MAKLTESYLRGMIKQVMKEAGTTPMQPTFQYSTPEGEVIHGDGEPISELVYIISDLSYEKNYPELLYKLKELLDHPALTNEDLGKIGDAVSDIVFGGSVQSMSDRTRSDQRTLNLGNRVTGMQESRKSRTAPKRK